MVVTSRNLIMDGFGWLKEAIRSGLSLALRSGLHTARPFAAGVTRARLKSSPAIGGLKGKGIQQI